MKATPIHAQRRRRKDARPDELIEAALAEFADRGFAAARLEDIARRAGLTKGTVYLYFSSKEELFEAVIRQTLAGAIARGLAAASDFQGPTPELLRIVLTHWWHAVVRSPAAALAKIMCAEAGNFPRLAQFFFEHVIEPARRLQQRIIERGVARGEFRALPVEHAAQFIIGGLLYVQLHESSFAKVLPQTAIAGDAFLDSFVELVLNALAPPGAST